MDNQPDILEAPDLEVKVSTDKEYQIILYNDDVNTFEHVIESLVKICSHNYEQAEQCALIVHFKGKCAVKKGSYEELKSPCVELQKVSLSATIE